MFQPHNGVLWVHLGDNTIGLVHLETSLSLKNDLPRRPHGGDLRILLIESDPAWQALVSSGLGGRGMLVQCRSAMAAALAEFDRWLPDAVLVDDTLPDQDGLEAVRQLRERIGARPIPVILMSARDDESLIERAFEVGVSDVSLKSLQWTLLSERLLHLVRSARAQAANVAADPTGGERGVDEALASLSRALVEAARDPNATDPLTGLASRFGFISAGEARLQPSEGRCSAIVLVNLDRFKRLNETLGPKVGDRALIEVADRLRRAFRHMPANSLAIGRLASDEFALLFSDLPSPEVASRIAEITFAHLKKPLAFDGLELLLRCSIGLAVCPSDADNIDDLLARADIALSEAKRRGGNHAISFDPSMGATVRGNFDMEAALHHALERGEILLYYQPILEVRTGRINGVEALMRWRRDGRVLHPAEFVPLAEESGLIFRMDEWVISEALQQVRRWQLEGIGLTSISVNINVRHLGQESLTRTVRQALEATRLDPSTLTLELTESEVMQDVERSLEALNALREMGVRLALDDFGTGYSSLGYLTQLPVDCLKIDRSFIHDMQELPQQLMVVRGIVALSSALGLPTVAEGVESNEDLRALRRIGCHLVQGYLFTEPLTASEFADWWREALAMSPQPYAGQLEHLLL